MLRDTIAEFLAEYPADTLGTLTSATAGLRYLRFCHERLGCEPVPKAEFLDRMAQEGVEFVGAGR